MEVDQSNSVAEKNNPVSDQSKNIEKKDGVISYEAFKNVKEEKNSYREKAENFEAKYNEMLEQAEELKRKELEDKKQYKELYEKASVDFEAVKTDRDNLVSDLINFNKVSYLESKLPAKFKKQEYKDFVTSKFLDQIKVEDGQVNEESVQVVVNQIMENYGADVLDLKTSSKMPNDSAPIENEFSLENLTREERIKLVLDRHRKK